MVVCSQMINFRGSCPFLLPHYAYKFYLLHCRYDMASNRWCGESHVPRNRACNFTFGFVVLGGELYVIASMRTLDPPKIQRLRQHRRPGTLYIQIYNPKRKTWRTLITKSPFYPYLDFNSTVICSIRL